MSRIIQSRKMTKSKITKPEIVTVRNNSPIKKTEIVTVRNNPPIKKPEIVAVDNSVNSPITAPTAKLQYRAIGVVQGQLKLDPTEPLPKVTTGTILLDHNQKVPCCIMKRMENLVQKKLDLSQPQWWVVYPYHKQGRIHFRLVGVWSQTLKPHIPPIPACGNKYFSVRGTVVQQKNNCLIVKIKRNMPTKGRQHFRLTLIGPVPEPNIVGWFCEFDAQFTNGQLTITNHRTITKIKKQRKSTNSKRKHSPQSAHKYRSTSHIAVVKNKL